MHDAISGNDWLRRASSALAAHPGLVRSARAVRGFDRGGHWMAEALAAARGREVTVADARFVRLGVRKYGLCALAGAGAAAAASGAGITWAIAAGGLAFYAVEARRVFDFPAAIDYGRRARYASRALHRRAGGTLAILARVLPIAAFMLFGWFANARPRENWATGCMAVLLWYESLRRIDGTTPPVLDVGALAPLCVRRVGGAATGPDSIKVLFASDLHLGAWGAARAMRDLVRVTVRERPHVVLLGGDLVDVRRALTDLAAWTRRLRRIAMVAAIPGNHDARWLAEVAAAVEEAGGHWLPEGPLRLPGLRIDGVLSPIAEDGMLRLLCAHDPVVFDAAVSLGYDVVMAGHLHGGQAIVCDVRGRHLPGAIISRWTGPTFTVATTTLWVSRGCADTLPVRFRCPREVLLATLRTASPTT